ncbi:MAG: PEP-utilizing enzyme [Patescibacteria group bacterium]|nr:PEP-utilizing enzyme [Patescibacteria group bacterium]
MSKINFQGQEYRLFFSNQLPPLVALNYADELFFKNFERLCGARYRILSIIRQGWQHKYGLVVDIKELTKVFAAKVSDTGWSESILDEYESRATALRQDLEYLQHLNFVAMQDNELAEHIKKVRIGSAALDAMSNMLHLFSSLVGDGFLPLLQNYSDDSYVINQNFIYYTQPLKESRFAKLVLKDLDQAFDLNPSDLNFSRILRLGAYIKDDVSVLLDSRGELMTGLFDQIAARLNVGKEDLQYLQITEIEKMLIAHQADPNLISQRRKLTVLFYPEKQLVVRQGQNAEMFLNDGGYQEVTERATGDVLYGQPASLGKAKGKVVVAENSHDAFEKMIEGAILVAPYTAVEYVPSMKKAAAIVTETGGITSHAAIVSRELGKPCVIGVENVMASLHDGDEVEVDADKGIVRIIKRAS